MHMRINIKCLQDMRPQIWIHLNTVNAHSNSFRLDLIKSCMDSYSHAALFTVRH